VRKLGSALRRPARACRAGSLRRLRWLLVEANACLVLPLPGVLPVVSAARAAGAHERAQRVSDGTQGNGGSGDAAIFVDGRFVAFASNAYNLVDSHTNGGWDIFVHDRTTHTTRRVSVSSTGVKTSSSVGRCVEASRASSAARRRRARPRRGSGAGPRIGLRWRGASIHPRWRPDCEPPRS
jgi:hypothetical protein